MEEHSDKEKPSKEYLAEEPEIHQLNEIDTSKTYSYASYLKWLFDERVELIKGKIFEMTAPTSSHQLISMRIGVQLSLYLENKPCLAFAAPFDVRFPDQSIKDEDIYTVVQPDITVVCDLGKIDRRGCIGVPDLTVEILSPSNTKRDLKIKHGLYQEYGVKEYWIIDPNKELIMKYVLNGTGVYNDAVFYDTNDQYFTSDALPGFELNIADLFDQVYLFR